MVHEWRNGDQDVRIDDNSLMCSVCARLYKPSRDPSYLWHMFDTQEGRHCICAREFCVAGSNFRMSSRKEIATVGEARCKLIPMCDEDLGKVKVDSTTSMWLKITTKDMTRTIATAKKSDKPKPVLLEFVDRVTSSNVLDLSPGSHLGFGIVRFLWGTGT